MPAMARTNIRRRDCSISILFAKRKARWQVCTSRSSATFCSAVSRARIFLLCLRWARVSRWWDRARWCRASSRQLGVAVSHNLEEVLPKADVVNLLRIQHERQRKEYFPGLGEYIRLFGLTKERAKLLKPDCLIMHPGPINRGVEIDSDWQTDAQSVILDQVTNGLAVRMAVLYLCGGIAT